MILIYILMVAAAVSALGSLWLTKTCFHGEMKYRHRGIYMEVNCMQCGKPF